MKALTGAIVSAKGPEHHAEISRSNAVNQALSTELVHELDLGSARGGKAGLNRTPVQFEVVRALTQADLPAITNPPPVAATAPVVQSLKYSHHRLAQLIAEGKPGTEISLATGYSQSYISTIQNDPAFADLVSYYAEQRKTIFVDAQERLRTLGLDATEKLHGQLNDATVEWSKRELMEVIQMTLPEAKGRAGPAGQGPGAGGGPAVSIEVKFVGARLADGDVVEASFRDVTPQQ